MTSLFDCMLSHHRYKHHTSLQSLVEFILTGNDTCDDTPQSNCKTSKMNIYSWFSELILDLVHLHTDDLTRTHLMVHSGASSKGLSNLYDTFSPETGTSERPDEYTLSHRESPSICPSVPASHCLSLYRRRYRMSQETLHLSPCSRLADSSGLP